MSYTTIVPTLDVYHVCPSTIKDENYQGYYAFDTSTSLLGSSNDDNAWLSQHREQAKQRINVDLGSAYIIRRMMYVNYHNSGGDMNEGIQYFQIYGSNSNIMFDSYNNGGGLTLLWDGKLERCTFDPPNPTAAFPNLPVYNPVPQYVTIDNMTPYKFYALKIWNNWEGNSGIGVRRIELQVEDGI